MCISSLWGGGVLTYWGVVSLLGCEWHLTVIAHHAQGRAPSTRLGPV